MPTTVGVLAKRLHGEVRGDSQLVLDGAESLDKAGPAQITYVSSDAYLRKLKQSRAGAVIVGSRLAGLLDETPHLPPAVILVDDPQVAFVQVLEYFRPSRPRPNVGVSPLAFVAATACIGRETNVFPAAYIADDVTIGDECDIYPGAYIGPGCRIGDGVVLHPGVVLYPGVLIGNRVTIHASTVLGADGFGYRLEGGRHRKIPHFGTVRVDDDVEIGACTTIDRAMIGETVIGEGSKIDNLVAIAHNCELGKHNALVSQVGLAGSVTTGDYVMCAGQVGVADHVHLGERCVLGAKSGVPKNVPAGAVYLGTPAAPITETRKAVMALKKLPELRQQVRELSAHVRELTARLQNLEAAAATHQESDAAA